MKLRDKYLRNILLAGIAGIAATSNAYGQAARDGASATPVDNGEVGDIIVTAQKREESISHVGISISAFSSDDLARFHVKGTEDLIKLVPGFTYALSGTNTPIFTLRGVGFNTIQMSATAPVGIYVNEVSYAYPYEAGGPIFDLERVEVLKGPQGTLYGRNTTGGLVNFITRQPTKDFQTGLTVDIGNYETHNVEGYVSGPLTDTLGARVAFRSENSDKGWQRSVTRPDDRLGKKDRFAARGILKWDPSPGYSFSLTGNYWRDKSDPEAAQAISFVDFGQPGLEPLIAASFVDGKHANQADWTPDNYPGPSPYSRTRPPLGIDARFFSVALRGDVDVTDAIKLTSITSYNDQKRHDMVNAGGTGLVEIGGSDLIGSIKSIQQELRLSGDIGPVNWLFGGYYAHDKLTDFRVFYNLDTGAFFATRALVTDQVFGPNNFPAAQIAQMGREVEQDHRQNSTTKSVYANAQWKMNDQFKLTAGVRYTADKTKFTGCLRDIDNSTAALYNYTISPILGLGINNIQPNQCATFQGDLVTGIVTGLSGLIHNTLSEDNVSGRLNLDWTPNSDLLVYASVGQGYKSGAFPFVSAILSSALIPYKQEKLIAYETGFKAKLFNRSMQLNASAFYYDYRNKQSFGRILEPVFVTTEVIVNIPKSRDYGVEGDLNWRISSALSARAAASYVKTKITKYVGYDEAGQPFDFKGFQFNYVPKFQASGGLAYTIPVRSDVNFEASADASYQSKSEGSLTADPRFAVRSYALVNGSIGIAAPDGRWRAALWGKNLFNKYYWTGTYVLLDTVVRYAGMPRTFGLTLSYNYQ